ncbi:MAG TPA: hypothetical protein VN081_05810 [Dongiaceae bacterium]|nr:hypothetical protein [Dongiaceae bacterium]
MTVKSLCEYAVGTWGSFDSEWVYYTSHETPFKALLRNAEDDFFNNASYHRLNVETQSVIYTTVATVLSGIYFLVDAIISQLNLSEYQTSTLVARHWIGKSLVMEINA